jgi:hypothetical protein
VPTKTIYIREADLGTWEEAQRVYGEKSMSTLFVECLKERLNARDGFLHVLRAEPGDSTRLAQFAVMFGPADSGGPMKPHYCRGADELARFLKNLGLTERAIEKIGVEVAKTRSSSVRVALSQDKIDLI